ncbi:helix-turn-helix domain-containing protein [Adhaeribacter pallidiroseus]|uniref:helix-turn-helix domain-containing protein n=1 Tax=Adhaeribacter pallidiroseus TaxID=2072847 RepID=UPI00131489D8|nr:helix-turn-helix transcriptional regulator [Adhaeribacter pallidiroseus]
MPTSKKVTARAGLQSTSFSGRGESSQQTIYRIEKAQFTVTLDVLVSLSEALQMPLKELVDFPRES